MVAGGLTSAEVQDIEVVTGDYLPLTVVIPGDYSAATIAAQVRTAQSHTAPLVGSFTVVSSVFDHVKTTVTIALEPSVTRAMGAYDVCYWDIEVTAVAGEPVTYRRGRFIVIQDVTA